MRFFIIFFSFLFVTANSDLLDGDFLFFLLQQSNESRNRITEPPAIIRIAIYDLNTAYDALAPYLENAVGIYSKIPRRPAHERTKRNKNIAIAYAVSRALEEAVPTKIPLLKRKFELAGLDFNDHSMDLRTPVGIGNNAAKMFLEVRQNDGMNELGNENGKIYNRIPFEDYTNYVPKNTAYKLIYPGKWQPNIERIGYGVFAVQQHIFPQYGLVLPYSINVSAYSSPPPLKSDPSNISGYKNQADEVLKESKELNDYKKMVAEHFDDKTASLAGAVIFLSKKYNLTQDEFIIVDLLANIALFDAGIVVWKEKLKYDSVRPFSAIRYLYENKFVEAWGGPGRGPVNNIRGKEWRSYLRTDAHSEYPSGSACFCAAQFTALKKYFNTNEFGFSVIKPKGSSVIEPNITPATDIKIGPYLTFDDYVNECAISRVWGGVHFRSAIEEGKRLCKPIGERAFNFVMKHVNGRI